jgi:hypothetical protein|tara:strand:- start:44 stop:337 length:294 start_codon:yes stop_codon:yes gene_type:complete
MTQKDLQSVDQEALKSEIDKQLRQIKANGAAAQGESLVNQMALLSDDLEALAVEVDEIGEATSLILIPGQARRFAKSLRRMSKQMNKNLEEGVMAIG